MAFSQEFLNSLGFITAIIYSIIPAVFLYLLRLNVFKEENISILGILFLYINGFVYFFKTAVDPKGIEVMDFCNLIGAYLGFVYLIVYIKYLFYKTEKNKFYFFICVIVFLSALIFAIEFLTRKIENIAKLIEWIGVIFNILEYLPLGFNLKYLLNNKISQKFTLLGGFIGLINTIVWLTWAIVTSIKEKERKKIHSVVANIFGLSLCIFQIIIYFKYRNEDEIIKIDDNKSDRITTTTINNSDNEVLETPKDDIKRDGTSEIIKEFI